MTYSVTRIDPHEYRSEIIALWKENFQSCKSPESRFNWLYNECPNGNVKTWLLFAEDGAVVGGCSFLPRNFFISGQGTIPSLTAIDLAVNKEHRSLGPALKLLKAMTLETLKDDYPFLIGHPNKNAEKLFKRVGFKNIGQERTWCKIIHSREKFEKRVRSVSLQKYLSYLLDVSQTLHLNVLKFIFRQNLTVHFLSQCDSRFDDLWKKNKDSLDIAIERSSEYLNWRFCCHADRDIQIMAVCKPDESLVGYIAFHIENKSAVIEDLFVINHFVTEVNLFVLFCLYARKHGLKTILVTELCSETNSYLLRRLFFFKYTESNRFMIKIDKHEENNVTNLLISDRRWGFWGDFDV